MSVYIECVRDLKRKEKKLNLILEFKSNENHITELN